MSITIRTIQEEDTPVVNRLSEQLGYPQTEAATAAQLRAVLSSTNDCAYVALDAENQVCGWIHAFKTMRIESPAFVEIGGLVVDDRYRGQGIGKVLTDAVRVWSRDQGILKLKVRSNVIRSDAHRFYSNLGFKENKEQKVFEQYL